MKKSAFRSANTVVFYAPLNAARSLRYFRFRRKSIVHKTMRRSVNWLARILLITSMGPLVGYCNETGAATQNLEDAMHDVLMHGKLTDTKYLSSKLGLDVEIPASEVNKSSNLRAIITKSPNYFFASGLSYTVAAVDAGDKSRVTLRFPLRSCPELQAWGRHWGKEVTTQMLSDAAGQEEALLWSPKGGISLNITYFSRGGCIGELNQLVSGKILFETLSDRPRDSGDALARSIADILTNADLRDYTRTASALHTKLIATGTQNSLLNEGYVHLANAVPEIDSSGFHYYADDTGWISPPSFVAMPRHLANRIAVLAFSPDVRRICLSIPSITKELDHRSIRYEREIQQDSDELVISLAGKNFIKLRMKSSEGCASYLHFEQITDIADNIGAPVVFPLDSSIDATSDMLNDAAAAQVDLLVRHVSAVRIGRIEIYQHLSDSKSKVQIQAAKKLAGLIRDSLIAKGISLNKIKVYETTFIIPNTLISWEKRIGEAGIFIDATAEN